MELSSSMCAMIEIERQVNQLEVLFLKWHDKKLTAGRNRSKYVGNVRS